MSKYKKWKELCLKVGLVYLGNDGFYYRITHITWDYDTSELSITIKNLQADHTLLNNVENDYYSTKTITEEELNLEYIRI